MTAEKEIMNASTKNLLSLKEELPYQYASIIEKRIQDRKDGKPPITAQQVRLVFKEEIQNPDIIIPVLEEAWRLYEEMQRINILKSKTLKK